MKAEQKSTSILFSCETIRHRSEEQLIADHNVVMVISGELAIQFQQMQITMLKGDIAIVRKNELVKAQKKPDKNGQPYKSVTVILSQELMLHYAIRSSVHDPRKYVGDPICPLNSNAFISSYFNSLLPYFDRPEKLTPKLTELKTEEAVELLLDCNMDSFLFDFSKPHKIDLQKFMNQNFIYDIPISEFARLTGRSLSTFKRDFKIIYDSTPEYWLTQKRLTEAKLLISDGQKPSDVCYNVGFKNFSHFSLAYKKKFGSNPSEK